LMYRLPLFSIIIPTRNREHFLHEAVESVLAQTMPDFEVMIVNDGDPFRTSLDDPRIRIVSNKYRGHVPARKKGLAKSRGKYIAFLDDDDVWIDRQHLERAAVLLKTRADFVFADGIMQFPDEKKPRIFSRDATPASLTRDNTILVSTVSYRRNIHQELGGFDDGLPYYWDWDWYLRVARAGFRMLRDAHQSVNIRIHQNNMSGDSNLEARQENLIRFAYKHKIPVPKLKNHADFAV
jgi:glycosyltransferase involved in cell wall biosynthesis